MRKRKYRAVLAALSLCTALSGCGSVADENGYACNIKAAVVAADGRADDTLHELNYGIMANIDAEKIGAVGDYDGYDILYLDESLADDAAFDVSAITDYVYGGGTVVLDNALAEYFPYDFLGAAEIVPIDGCPADMVYPNYDDSLTDISELLYDFTYAFKNYADFETYAESDYGVGIVPDTATVIAEYNGCGVYTVNRYGEGSVFFTNPILPAKYTVSSLREGEDGRAMAFTSTGAENLLLGYFAEYVSKAKYGFAVERTFGSYGTNVAAWELHYEDITGVANDSLREFSRRCMEKGQMPSYTIARNMYTWFKRAESVTYLKSDGEKFVSDPYENAYSSGTHIASGGKWLELESYDKTESYFDDDPQYIKRAYPCPLDKNGDGKTDLICGSSDGKFYYYEGYGMGENYETSVATYLTDTDGNTLSVGAYSSPTLCDIDGDGKDEIISGSEDGTVYAFRSLADESNPSSLAYEAAGEILQTGLEDGMVSAGDITGDDIADLAVGSRTGEIRVYTGYYNDYGEIAFGDEYIPVESDESWAAPCIYNGDLYAGTLEGFVAEFVYGGDGFVLKQYLETDDISRRGDYRITIGMNCVPRFADIDGDGNDDLICGSLEYGMAYPIDSGYFPYTDRLKEQLEFCRDYNIYMGVHSYTHEYATPEHEAREMEYHKTAFDTLGIEWDGIGANQHTWFTSSYGYDGSGIDGYNPAYDGTFSAQYDAGLLWNSGAAMPESGVTPQNCAEDAIPMPMYMQDRDFLLLETSNTPHGKGEFSYISVKYGMPMLFYNHCDYIYDDPEEQYSVIDKVGEVTDKYEYMFVGENQMAKVVSAAYNTQCTVEKRGSDIVITASVRDTERKLYDKNYTDAIGVRVVFGADSSAADYTTDAAVAEYGDDSIRASVDGGTLVLKANGEGVDAANGNGAEIEQINLPAKVKKSDNGAVITFRDNGLMCVRIKGKATAVSDGWTAFEKDGDTVLMKFGKAQKLKISVK